MDGTLYIILKIVFYIILRLINFDYCTHPHISLEYIRWQCSSSGNLHVNKRTPTHLQLSDLAISIMYQTYYTSEKQYCLLQFSAHEINYGFRSSYKQEPHAQQIKVAVTPTKARFSQMYFSLQM